MTGEKTMKKDAAWTAMGALLALALAGCAADKPPVEEPAESDAATEAGREATRERIDKEKTGEGSMGDGAQIADVGPVYFAFDSYAVPEDERKKIRRAARFLKENSSASLRLEGHADERGAADYNMVLSRRRAGSVKELLRSYGVESDRIETVGYGEEFPAAQGHNEAAWRQNRRVEFVFETG